MFKINGEPDSPHEGAHLGGVLNKMYDEPISLAKHANVASDTVNAHSQRHKQLSSEVICQFIRTVCSAPGQGKEVGFVRTVQWFGYQGFEPCFRKPYFLHIPSAKTNRSNELTFDLVAQLLVSVHMTSLLSCL